MKKIEIQPELRTSGGESLSIHREGEWIGDIFLIYRENDLLTGTVQLDQALISPNEVEQILGQLRPYLMNLGYALNVTDHNIHIYYGKYSHWEDYHDSLEDEFDDNDDDESGYERWIVGQGKNGIEYQIYDDMRNLIAEAVVDLRGTKIIGEINFTEEPTEQIMEDVEAILLKDYDHDLIDQYNFTFLVGGQDYEEVQIEPDEEEEISYSELDQVEMLERVEWEEDQDQYEEQERAEVIFDLVDRDDQHLAEAKFLYSEDGVDVVVDMKVKPNEDVTNHLMHMVFKEALTEAMEWVNIRMKYRGEFIDGFHFERGQGETSIEQRV